MNPLLAKYSWQRNNEIISQTIFSYQILLDQQKISNMKLMKARFYDMAGG